MRWIGMFAIAIALVSWSAPSRAEDCEAARCAVQAAIDANCSCQTMNGRNNHGRYVSCVAHEVKRLSDEGAIPVECKGKVKRCAARSTCGKKEGFVICQIPTDTCNLVTDTCDQGTLTCTGNPAVACAIDDDCTTGTCAANPSAACATDLDCGSRCKISSTDEHCAKRGGFVDPTKTTCCSSCSVAP